MNFIINGEQLRKALKEIRAAEKNGFMFCEAVLDVDDREGTWIKLRFSDLWEKAHPTNGNFDWGRFQGVSKHNKFKNGRLVKIITAQNKKRGL